MKYILKYSGIIYFAQMESSKLNKYAAESWRTRHSTMVANNTKYYSFKPNQTKPKLRGLGFLGFDKIHYSVKASMGVFFCFFLFLDFRGRGGGVEQ
jgi:hypothetical protein